jgi:hypothetical protein
LVTGNEQHARNMVDIAHAWATTNKVFQYEWANGPLNSAWFVASLTKGLELLKYSWQGYAAYKVGSARVARCNECRAIEATWVA